MATRLLERMKKPPEEVQEGFDQGENNKEQTLLFATDPSTE